MKLKRFIVLALFVVGFSGCAGLSEDFAKVRDTVVETTFESAAGLTAKILKEGMSATSTILTGAVDSVSGALEEDDAEE